MQAVEISQQLLMASKLNEPTEHLVAEIAKLKSNQLAKDISEQNQRLVFWINLYNAFFQIKVKEDPSLFKQKVKLFFGKHFTIAGQKMSLDNIEHDMLRRSAYKWSLGYIKKFFPSAFEKKLQVYQLDNRIHFALNCGAISCPPIRFYTVEKLDEELNLASRNFLEQEATYDAKTNTASITSLFNWFRGDFGGINGIKSFLIRFEKIPNKNVKIKFKAYNWEQQFENYG